MQTSGAPGHGAPLHASLPQPPMMPGAVRHGVPGPAPVDAFANPVPEMTRHVGLLSGAGATQSTTSLYRPAMTLMTQQVLGAGASTQLPPSTHSNQVGEGRDVNAYRPCTSSTSTGNFVYERNSAINNFVTQQNCPSGDYFVRQHNGASGDYFVRPIPALPAYLTNQMDHILKQCAPTVAGGQSIIEMIRGGGRPT